MKRRLVFGLCLPAMCVAGSIVHCLSCGSFPALPELPQDSTPGIALINKRDASPLKIVVIDVGQGDATLLVTPAGRGILIDCGPEEAVDIVRKTLAQYSITTLEAIFISHYHADHIGGCALLVAGEDGLVGTEDDFPVSDGVLDRGDDPLPSVEGFKAYQEAFGGIRHTLRPGQALEWDSVIFAIKVAGGLLESGQVMRNRFTEENALSVGMLIEYGGFRYFTAGDITGGGGRVILSGVEGPTTNIETELGTIVGDIDVLHVAHHGSQTSTNSDFLRVVRPEIAIISVGEKNDYFHPHLAVLSRLLAQGTEVWRTNQEGSIQIEASGSDFHVFPLKSPP